MPVGSGLRRWLGECLDGLDALAYPWTCRICDQASGRSPFCDGCRDELLDQAGPWCPRCAMPVGPWTNAEQGCVECRNRRLGFDGATALGMYSGPIRALCLQLKHERNAWLARWLADLLVEAREPRLRAQGGSCVVPVPLHWRRRWSRGYNQAELLADRVGSRLGLPVVHALRRVVATPSLARMRRTERARVMRGAFRSRELPRLRGESVILVDDILTTGATCGAAARALKQAGAARVLVAVVGRAEGAP